LPCLILRFHSSFFFDPSFLLASPSLSSSSRHPTNTIIHLTISIRHTIHTKTTATHSLLHACLPKACGIAGVEGLPPCLLVARSLEATRPFAQKESSKRPLLACLASSRPCFCHPHPTHTNTRSTAGHQHTHAHVHALHVKL
jgi:hypothetical protein